MNPITLRSALCAAIFLGLLGPGRAFADFGVDAALDDVKRHSPGAIEDAARERTASLVDAADRLDDRCGELAWSKDASGVAEPLARVRKLAAIKQDIDRQLEAALDLRAEFGKTAADEKHRERIRQYLAQTSRLIDLSGRMRYLLRDAVDHAALALAKSPKRMEALVDLLTEKRISVGAQVLADALFDPIEDDAPPASPAIKEKIIELIAAAGQPESLPDLVDYLNEPEGPPALVIKAAEAIRTIGLPQDPLPGQDVKTNPPPILAPELKQIVTDIETKALRPELASRRERLLDWLDERIRRGITDTGVRVGDYEVQSGDWLLMRNPSPYNTFTDLSPGLFTHVGLVAELRDQKGVRRLVITDLPERGERIPAETVDAYLRDTQHYVFLRHAEEEVRQAMGKAAAEMIGNETQFDLLFDTSRVLALRGESLRGKRIHTYCAGFLLICAQQTGRPREEFFPVPEFRPGGHCQDNLEKLGLAIGEDFVSPTGAMFSSRLEIVGRREPLYDPARQVKEHVYDYFGRCMVEKTLTPAPDLYQSLRQTAADLSKKSPWLARTLAKVNNVSPYMDLESAARAAAVVETLDRIADESRDGFLTARKAFLAGPESSFAEQQISAAEAKVIRQERARHSGLYKKWTAGQIAPRELRIALVDYYQKQGRRQLDERFFTAK